MNFTATILTSQATFRRNEFENANLSTLNKLINLHSLNSHSTEFITEVQNLHQILKSPENHSCEPGAL